ncbi:MAG: GNAT family N-acetyltransferase [Candidatus Pacebacteria bacterium]|nr:GNAT family N-acetyltransferase [Candidatus Paceibacterota bacterium]
MTKWRYELPNRGIVEGELPEDEQEIAYLDFIHTLVKGNGLGTELLRIFEKAAIEAGAIYIQGIIGTFDDTDPEKLISFYKKNGYEVRYIDGDLPVIEKKL